MANNFDISNAAASAAADAVTALVNGGTLRIYSGTKPAGPDTGLSGNTVLAELTFGNPAFGSASNGVATANSITADSSANATGTASFFRAFASNGTTAVFDGEVGTGGWEAAEQPAVSGRTVSRAEVLFPKPASV